MIAKSVFITGANRGLGLQLAKKLSQSGWQIFATARNVADLKEIFKKEAVTYQATFELDLFKTPTAKIKPMFDELPTLDAVIHCASPYTLVDMIKATDAEVAEYNHCMLLDQVIMKHAITKLNASNNNGVLAVTGAVIGLPHFFSRGIMGLVKAQQRQLSGILECELAQQTPRKTYVRHFDLGSFREEVSEPNKYLETSFVADVIIKSLEAPEQFPADIHLVSHDNESVYKVDATITPEDFYKTSQKEYSF